MTQLSVNVNKIATLRNSRGGDVPNVLTVAQDCEKFGADGITVHPRPDERHITRKDVYQLKDVVKTEFNIEGYPSEDFISLVKDVMPAQVTLVPDAPDAITSNSGWDTKKHHDFLKAIVADLKAMGIRVSIFVDPDVEAVEWAAKAGANRIELYTEPYASGYKANKEESVKAYIVAANRAKELGLKINAGHDLSLDNLDYFLSAVNAVDEVSIGHALISEALYLGLSTTINNYLDICHKTK
ncbi:MAG: pyridoxine 5'-phosphate synthase [Bacteroidales bacterium]